MKYFGDLLLATFLCWFYRKVGTQSECGLYLNVKQQGNASQRADSALHCREQ